MCHTGSQPVKHPHSEYSSAAVDAKKRCTQVERLHALSVDPLMSNLRPLVAYIGTRASITRALHHKATYRYSFKVILINN